jgi:hypothetical protein
MRIDTKRRLSVLYRGLNHLSAAPQPVHFPKNLLNVVIICLLKYQCPVCVHGIYKKSNELVHKINRYKSMRKIGRHRRWQKGRKGYLRLRTQKGYQHSNDVFSCYGW